MYVELRFELQVNFMQTFRVKWGNLVHGVIRDGGAKAVSTMRCTHIFLVSAVSNNWAFSVASMAKQLNHSRSKGPVSNYPSTPSYTALPY